MDSTAEIARLFDRAWYQQKLRAAGEIYTSRRDYSEFTPSAASKLEKLERDAVGLAIQLLAYDARQSAAAMIDCSRRGDDDGLICEKSALTGRVLGNWAWTQVQLNHLGFDLRELAAPLKIGLGPELQKWLMIQGPAAREAADWLQKHGPKIERFLACCSKSKAV